MYLNTEIEARVIEMDRNRNHVVLSRRVVLEESLSLIHICVRQPGAAAGNHEGPAACL